MRPDQPQRTAGKLPYRCPELRAKGSVEKLTQQTVKQLGSYDGFVLLDQGPLSNLS